MIIGVPKEIKNNENRVAMTPAGVAELVHNGHTVYVQHTAGEGSGFADDEYIAAGAQILPTIEAVYDIAEMIVKVKEPIEPEYKLIKKDQVVFTYFHFASDRELTDAMMASRAVCIAKLPAVWPYKKAHAFSRSPKAAKVCCWVASPAYPRPKCWFSVPAL